MRIIGGTHKGRILKVPPGLPVRPTTDFAKEGLFNSLSSRLDLEGLKVLDLFSGTGHISLEFASRGAASVTAVDQNFKCVSFLRQSSEQLKLRVSAVKSDVFKFLEDYQGRYDLIFADPPYDLVDIPQIHQLVFQKELLSNNGLLVIEHGPRTDLSQLSNFLQHRKYGNVNFSLFTGD